VRTGGFTTNDREHREIEGRAQIMDGVADNEGEIWRNGFLGFGFEGNLAQLRLAMSDELERFLSQVGLHSPVKVIDVMLGPLNL